MPFALLFVGILLLVSAVRNTTSDLGKLLASDFAFTKGGYVYWMLAILAIGAVGYITPLRPLSRSFMFLLIVVLFLSKGGFWSKLESGLGISSFGNTANTPL